VVQGTLQHAAPPKARSHAKDWPAPDGSPGLRVVWCLGGLLAPDEAPPPEDDAAPIAGVVLERAWPVPRTVPDN
jgi:hypothetical protein